MVGFAKPFSAISATPLLLGNNAANVTCCVTTNRAFSRRNASESVRPLLIRMIDSKSATRIFARVGEAFEISSTIFTELLWVVGAIRSFLRYDPISLKGIKFALSLTLFIGWWVSLLVFTPVFADLFFVVALILACAWSSGSTFTFFTSRSDTRWFVGTWIKELCSGGIERMATPTLFQKSKLFHSVSLSLYHIWSSADGVISRRSGISLADPHIITRKAS